MNLLKKLKTARRILLKPPGWIHRIRLYIAFRIFTARWAATESFDLKIREVLPAPENARIPKHPDAGKILNGYLIMHNGIRIVPNSYVGEGMTRLLQANGGVHEPQEEFAFGEVLDWIPKGGSMLELGSYWAFYSLWFSQRIPDAKCYCVEPEEENLQFGKANFDANGKTACFSRGFIGGKDESPRDARSAPTRCVDSLMREFEIDHLDILHADIQGYELEMLRGAQSSLAEGKIDYIFISSHSNELHYDCMEFLENHGCVILAEADLLETFSESV